MSTAEQIQFISVDDYFRLEEHSAARNEYVNGWIRAMTGATNRHNDIAVNILISLGKKLAGKVCKPCNSDTKIRIRHDSATCFTTRMYLLYVSATDLRNRFKIGRC